MDTQKPAEESNIEPAGVGSEAPTTKSVNSEFFVIKPSPGKGLGAFATSDIKYGTRILAEWPIIRVEKYEYTLADINSAFDSMSAADKDIFWALHSCHGQDPAKWPAQGPNPGLPDELRERIAEQHAARVADAPSILSVFQANCMPFRAGGGVYAVASRFNHACMPNVAFAWNDNIQKLTLHAARDVRAGEELFVSYCDELQPKEVRAWSLAHYGFACECEVCADDGVEGSPGFKHRVNREKLQCLADVVNAISIDHIPFAMHFGPSHANQRLMALFEVLSIMKEENMFGSQMCIVYRELAMVCEEKGDYDNAVVAARKELETYLRIMGPDSPMIPRAVALARRLKSRTVEEVK
ncbi:hypothetical protein BDY21DRAFT_382435 [Lineolata rhizophorae]|uniref:SET domain-containing protein n=1 Tax=Lineolata rhizophorae TaxID=578093 RepID=A0A6A6NMH9_9PEZI|nr:hypothetical protein BDY21DRAFT_382435 [Lineolata rhizophorae]